MGAGPVMTMSGAQSIPRPEEPARMSSPPRPPWNSKNATPDTSRPGQESLCPE
ncbi:conserved domain protein [Actinomyces sp. oral taxon 170 str. F0386]|nr:conserved domain protein [Actinomyces sp. oral taxon 170 str. F0386]